MDQNLSGKSESGKPKLLDEVRRILRLKHYSIRTEQAYLDWIRRFMKHHRMRHPRDMGGAEVTAFLSHLAVEGNVSASTQNQALAALLFLYKVVLGVELPWLGEVERAKRPARLPVVLTQEEARRVVAALEGSYQI
ncbi:MAG: phage integrase N-terminal SAM-like domain-containing protein, partial [Limisphaerales bacterium]